MLYQRPCSYLMRVRRVVLTTVPGNERMNFAVARKGRHLDENIGSETELLPSPLPTFNSFVCLRRSRNNSGECILFIAPRAELKTRWHFRRAFLLRYLFEKCKVPNRCKADVRRNQGQISVRVNSSAPESQGGREKSDERTTDRTWIVWVRESTRFR